MRSHEKYYFNKYMIYCGADYQHQSLSCALQEATLQLLPPRHPGCQWITAGRARKEETLICATATTADTCGGDSGGPLFIVGPGGQATQLGIGEHVSKHLAWFVLHK